MSSQIITFVVLILFVNLQLISASGDNDGNEAKVKAPATPEVKKESKNGTAAKSETPAEKAKEDNVDERKSGDHVAGEVCMIDEASTRVFLNKENVVTCNRCGHNYPSPRECMHEGAPAPCPREVKEATIQYDDGNGKIESVKIPVTVAQLLVQKGVVPFHKTVRHLSALKHQFNGVYGKWTEAELEENKRFYTGRATLMDHESSDPHNCHCC